MFGKTDLFSVKNARYVNCALYRMFYYSSVYQLGNNVIFHRWSRLCYKYTFCVQQRFSSRMKFHYQQHIMQLLRDRGVSRAPVLLTGRCQTYKLASEVIGERCKPCRCKRGDVSILSVKRCKEDVARYDCSSRNRTCFTDMNKFVIIFWF